MEFETDHLLSKWGFQDGEYLNDFLRDNGYDDLDEDSEAWFHFSRRVLCEVVECYVCPLIKNEIKPYRTFTSHNPIRVYEVDRRHVTDWEQTPTLNPFTVSVAEEHILETAARLYAERLTNTGEIAAYTAHSQHARVVYQAHGWE